MTPGDVFLVVLLCAVPLVSAQEEDNRQGRRLQFSCPSNESNYTSQATLDALNLMSCSNSSLTAANSYLFSILMRVGNCSIYCGACGPQLCTRYTVKQLSCTNSSQCTMCDYPCGCSAASSATRRFCGEVAKARHQANNAYCLVVLLAVLPLLRTRQ